MDHALDNRLTKRLDNKTTRRTRVLFGVTFLAAAAASPFFALYELLLGTLGLVATAMLGRRTREGTGLMTATVIFAGILAGIVPYLLAAPFVP